MIFYSFKNKFILLVLVCMLFTIPAFSMADKDNNTIKDADYFINLAQEYVDSGKYEEAIDTYKQAIKVHPDDAVAYYKLGIAYRSAGKMLESVDILQQAIQIKPEFAVAHDNLALAYKDSGDMKKATAQYKTLQDVNAESANKLHKVLYP